MGPQLTFIVNYKIESKTKKLWDPVSAGYWEKLDITGGVSVADR
jgi:hypothetical protein